MSHKPQEKYMVQLNREQELFLELAACFIHDEKAETGEVLPTLDKLANLAGVHKMSPAIFEVLRVSDAGMSLNGQEFWTGWKRNAIREIIFQTRRTEGFLALYRKFLEAGMKPLVVKGIICRSLYSKADYRISSDEDVLVRKEDAALCDEILTGQGFFRDKLDLENLPHEIAYRNPESGVYIELHFSLFDEGSGIFGRLNPVFEDVFDCAVSVPVQDVGIWTLNPTKHFWYLLCHCYKHFLFSGFGIRQVCDIVIMAEKWGSQMDWTYLKEQIKAFQMERFFAGLMQIGFGWLHMSSAVYEHMGKVMWVNETFSREDISIADARAESIDLLQDILAAGIYGSSTRERLHSANITLAAAKKESGILNALFPNIDYMKARYRYVERCPLLLPAAWGARMGHYLLKDMRKNPQGTDAGMESSDSGSSLEIGRKRVELIRKYGLME